MRRTEASRRVSKRVGWDKVSVEEPVTLSQNLSVPPGKNCILHSVKKTSNRNYQDFRNASISNFGGLSCHSVRSGRGLTTPEWQSSSHLPPSPHWSTDTYCSGSSSLVCVWERVLNLHFVGIEMQMRLQGLVDCKVCKSIFWRVLAVDFMWTAFYSLSHKADFTVQRWVSWPKESPAF